MIAYNFVCSGRNFTQFLTPKDSSRQRHLDFVAIFIGFEDIRGQTRKLS